MCPAASVAPGAVRAGVAGAASGLLRQLDGGLRLRGSGETEGDVSGRRCHCEYAGARVADFIFWRGCYPPGQMERIPRPEPNQ